MKRATLLRTGLPFFQTVVPLIFTSRTPCFGAPITPSYSFGNSVSNTNTFGLDSKADVTRPIGVTTEAFAHDRPDGNGNTPTLL